MDLSYSVSQSHFVLSVSQPPPFPTMHTHIYIHQPYTQNKERMNITQKKREMQKPFYKRRSTRNKSQTLYQMMMMVMNEAAKKL